MAIDAEATGILIESGVDPLTALVASTTPEPREPTGHRSRLWLWISGVCGAITAIIIHGAGR
jgi:hypothetical protein